MPRFPVSTKSSYFLYRLANCECPLTRQNLTVSALARESGFDLEDVIIELVRSGLTYAIDPRAYIRSEDLRKARSSIGLHAQSDERKKSYWSELLGLSNDDLEHLLDTLHVPTNGRARTLPKGAHAKLRSYADSRLTKVTRPSTPSALRTADRTLTLAEPVVWKTIGQKRPNNMLVAADVLLIHEELERDAEQAADPIFPPGVKSLDLLESACSRPQTGMPNDPKYPTVEMAAAALVHSLVNNHTFYNGNKRTALVSMMVFLDQNNHWLRDTVRQADLYLWILEVARHRLLAENFAYPDRADREVLEMSEWIRRNSRAIERSERPITWRDLRTILTRDYECEIDQSSSGRVVIRRTVTVSSRNLFRGFKKNAVKTFTITPGGDGKEVGLGTVKTLRTQLCLTEDYRIDSAIFYGSVASSDHFISKYQRLLRDLAKV